MVHLSHSCPGEEEGGAEVTDISSRRTCDWSCERHQEQAYGDGTVGTELRIWSYEVAGLIPKLFLGSSPLLLLPSGLITSCRALQCVSMETRHGVPWLLAAVQVLCTVNEAVLRTLSPPLRLGVSSHKGFVSGCRATLPSPEQLRPVRFSPPFFQPHPAVYKSADITVK
ncbi:hypothetical protein SKAU_G00288290 [Synaphobranchus kaupii]|uniref:Uncharacterized protein n=1 Tax=Synaphobranchus kaupii TaxID=118154 RepID=A0A9Q1IM51_SYNKA|nr:hypothetical protein SKAU_G00288290 [Synaphobranchus kaupii]